MNELDKYEKLSKIAKSIGLTWVFNSIEGLEFAIDFFKKPEKISMGGHNFNNHMICNNCGVAWRNYKLIPNRFNTDDQCIALQNLKKYHNIENINEDMNELFRNS